MLIHQRLMILFASYCDHLTIHLVCLFFIMYLWIIRILVSKNLNHLRKKKELIRLILLIFRSFKFTFHVDLLLLKYFTVARNFLTISNKLKKFFQAKSLKMSYKHCAHLDWYHSLASLFSLINTIVYKFIS